MSHEVSVTFSVDGKWYNAPSMSTGIRGPKRKMSEDFVRGKTIEGIESGNIAPGVQGPFNSRQEAEAAAKLKSDSFVSGARIFEKFGLEAAKANAKVRGDLSQKKLKELRPNIPPGVLETLKRKGATRDQLLKMLEIKSGPIRRFEDKIAKKFNDAFDARQKRRLKKDQSTADIVLESTLDIPPADSEIAKMRDTILDAAAGNPLDTSIVEEEQVQELAEQQFRFLLLQRMMNPDMGQTESDAPKAKSSVK